MVFSKQEQEALSLNIAITSRSPWVDGSHKVDELFRHIIPKITTEAKLKADGDFDSYGSGYASFVEVFLYPEDDSSRVYPDNLEEGVCRYNGIFLMLSRLTPVYTLGEGDRSWRNKQLFGGITMPNAVMKDAFLEPYYHKPLRTIRKILKDYWMEEYSLKDLQSPLEEGVFVHGMLGGEYRKPTEFDALYHWED